MKSLFASFLLAIFMATGMSEKEAYEAIERMNAAETQIETTIATTEVETSVVVEEETKAAEPETKQQEEETLPAATEAETKAAEPETKQQEETQATTETATPSSVEKEEEPKSTETQPTTEAEVKKQEYAVNKKTGLPEKRTTTQQASAGTVNSGLVDSDLYNSNLNRYRVVVDKKEYGLYDYISDHSFNIDLYDDLTIGYYGNNWIYYEIHFTDNSLSSYYVVERDEIVDKTIEEIINDLHKEKLANPKGERIAEW